MTVDHCIHLLHPGRHFLHGSLQNTSDMVQGVGDAKAACLMSAAQVEQRMPTLALGQNTKIALPLRHTPSGKNVLVLLAPQQGLRQDLCCRSHISMTATKKHGNHLLGAPTTLPVA
eukprot:CAMPEP_0181406146 /NCGR_PEP_ID=MMETSP1110-20121109/5123_1 /TAXON_ID=174948 /ORGANISM="Symbiodinium sp., Strain CCMP421" /LENGTH=115 /DNA_ID=CAMNT_0023528553 /DNA_START=557 /DNA_END=904 /DNA_ORIENTATION=-